MAVWIDPELPELFRGLVFDPGPHVYHLDGVRCVSSTGVVESVCPPFDPDGQILLRSARKHFKHPETLKKEWEQAATDGAQKGTICHDYAEHLLKFWAAWHAYDLEKPEAREDWRGFVDSTFAAVQWLIENEHFEVRGVELRMWIRRYLVAGTADLLVWNRARNWYEVWDWKTTKEINHKSKYRNWMTGPCSHLEDCEAVHYAIQLGIYRQMIERRFAELGRDVPLFGPSRVLHLRADGWNPRRDVIRLPELGQEVQAVLDWEFENRERLQASHKGKVEA